MPFAAALRLFFFVFQPVLFFPAAHGFNSLLFVSLGVPSSCLMVLIRAAQASPRIKIKFPHDFLVAFYLKVRYIKHARLYV
jgi:hypothetical protein